MIEIKRISHFPYKQINKGKNAIKISDCILCTDGKDNYLIFKFENHFIEPLNSVSFEVRQYDSNNKMIDVSYGKFEHYDDAIHILKTCVGVEVYISEAIFSTLVLTDEYIDDIFKENDVKNGYKPVASDSYVISYKSIKPKKTIIIWCIVGAIAAAFVAGFFAITGGNPNFFIK